MELFPYLNATANTMAILSIVYLVLIYWVRHPDRRAPKTDDPSIDDGPGATMA